jgi:predicted AAA+ superfamily ATPase
MGKLLPNLAKAPKHFLMDTAIAITLLAVSRDELTTLELPKKIGKFNKTFVGQLFESFVYQSLIVYAELNDAELSHFRLASGTREIDFIMKKGKRLLLIEVKTGVSVSEDDARHLNWFEAEAADEYKITKLLIHAGPFAYTRNDGVHVIPASMLGV